MKITVGYRMLNNCRLFQSLDISDVKSNELYTRNYSVSNLLFP